MGKSIVEQSKEDVKNKQRENTEMNAIKRINWNTIVTVVITLVAIASLGGMFLLGMSYQSRQDETIKLEAVNLSKAMASKENQ